VEFWLQLRTLCIVLPLLVDEVFNLSPIPVRSVLVGASNRAGYVVAEYLRSPCPRLAILRCLVMSAASELMRNRTGRGPSKVLR